MSSDATVVWGEEWGRVGGQGWFLQSERVPTSDAIPRVGRASAETSFARWDAKASRPGGTDLLGLCFLTCPFLVVDCPSVESKQAFLFFFFNGGLPEIG